MADLNQFQVQGRLTADAEYSTFGQKATPKLKFALANNIGYGDFKHANFFNCELIGKRADSLAPYLKKGKAIIITGEMKQERWETSEGKRSMVKLYVSNLHFVGGEKQDSSDSPEYPEPAKDNPFAQKLSDDENPFKVFNDDIPF